MPNWCSNGVTLRHEDPSMIERAMNSQGLFMEFLPTPQELRDTVAGFPGVDKEAEHRLQQESNVKKYGHKDWYEWNIANWGVKWDVDLDNIERVDANTLTASFESPWGPPIEGYRRLEDLGFEVEGMFYEPGMAFCGRYDTEFGEDSMNLEGLDSNTVRGVIGEDLDDYFGISENMAQWEEENQ